MVMWVSMHGSMHGAGINARLAMLASMHGSLDMRILRIVSLHRGKHLAAKELVVSMHGSLDEPCGVAVNARLSMLVSMRGWRCWYQCTALRILLTPGGGGAFLYSKDLCTFADPTHRGLQISRSESRVSTANAPYLFANIRHRPLDDFIFGGTRIV